MSDATTGENTAMGAAGWIRKRLRQGLVLLAGILALPFILAPVFIWFNPPVSSLMLWRLLEGNGLAQSWVPLSDIAAVLPNTVLMTEDGRFCDHSGVDWSAVQDVLDDVSDGGNARGASTITMQTAKNLFLWPYPTLLRKVLEVPLAYELELFWGKRRIMEVYLNIAEWGPGIYGAEQAAQYHFSRSAKDLTARQAALLAAVLPNPIAREAGNPGRQTSRLAARAQRRGAQAGAYVTCLR
mgnify:FL=1